MIAILFLIGSIGCTKTVIQDRYIPVKPSIDILDKPTCLKFNLSVKFEHEDKRYCLNRSNAINLLIKRKETKSCLKKYKDRSDIVIKYLEDYNSDIEDTEGVE